MASWDSRLSILVFQPSPTEVGGVVALPPIDYCKDNSSRTRPIFTKPTTSRDFAGACRMDRRDGFGKKDLSREHILISILVI
jgi:hypothetical protein